MGTIWIVCFVCGFIPFAIFFGVQVPDRLSDQPNAKWPACTLKIEWYISKMFQIFNTAIVITVLFALKTLY